MRTINPTKEHADRLAKYTIRKGDDECWGWSASTDEHGYGRIRVQWVEYAVHRLAYAIHSGADPGELDVLHRCDNPTCTNPKHLFLGTHTDNMRDAARKGRLTSAGIPRNVGEKNAQAKLSDEQVRRIRELKAAGMKQKDIAPLFGVSRSYISLLVNDLNRRYQPDHMEDAARALE
jgi:predicted XRE-type DNA-binding protein